MRVFSFRLLNVLEVIAPFKHFNKLREFVQMKLPPGFPVKLGELWILSETRGYYKIASWGGEGGGPRPAIVSNRALIKIFLFVVY